MEIASEQHNNVTDQNQPKKKKIVGCSSKKVTKRTTNPGVRVVHGRIYDSENGKTCHQCRQKTRDFVATCKNQKNNKPCPLAFCHTCLLNRYGEKAEEMEALEDWSCPRCRDICNCSFCMKKRGHQPTGMLLHKAKAMGYSSVSEYVKNVKDMGASEKEILASSPRKRGKKNSLDGKIDVNLEDDGLLKGSSPCPNEKKLKIINQGALKKHAGQEDGDKEKTRKLKLEVLNKMPNGKIEDGDFLEGSPKKPRVANESKNKEVKKPNRKVDGVLEEGKKASVKVPLDPSRKKKKSTDIGNKIHKDMEERLDREKNQNRKRKGLRFQSRDLDADVMLPNGTELTTIAGIELPLKDVGNALQFLEFCAAFGKILNLKKGQSNFILQELINGRSRREQYSAVVQFHIQLVSLLGKESGSMSHTSSPTRGKTNWMYALKNCLSESQSASNWLPFDGLDRESDGYHTLDSSTKLRILIYLCDKVLETESIRNFIDDQNSKLSEEAKEAKERILKAKDKEKRLKQKMLDKAAKAIIAKNGARLSIAEHDKMVGQIKSKAAQAHAEMLESMGTVSKKKRRPDAVRTEAILLDVDGHAYWRLNGYSEKSKILIQDIGSGDDSVAVGEKWLAFDAEQEKVIERHISFRERRLKASTVTGQVPSSRT